LLDSTIILNHTLVPKHEVMKNKEVDGLLKEFNLTKDLLPKINESDPIIEAIGAKKGDVLKITRDSLTAGKAVSYRIVY